MGKKINTNKIDNKQGLFSDQPAAEPQQKRSGDTSVVDKTMMLTVDSLAPETKLSHPPVLVNFDDLSIWNLEPKEYMVGSSSDADIVAYGVGSGVSKSHALIDVRGDESSQRVFISDQESVNGTRVIVTGDLGLKGKKRIHELVPYVPYELNSYGVSRIQMGRLVLQFFPQNTFDPHLFNLMRLDALTGVFNRASLMSHAKRQFMHAQKYGEDFSLLVLDVDHFKKINDTYGHQLGDYVLKEMVQVVQKELKREDDFFARFGGEEFVILLSGRSGIDGAVMARHICKTVSSHKFLSGITESGVRPLSVSVSVGVATLVPGDTKWEQLFKRADKALYDAKHAGRNCVRTSFNVAS